jgi:hypothetical protein
MSINNNRKVQLIRTFYSKKGIQDSTRSGGYKGELSLKEYNRLLALLRTVKWEELQVEKVTCCDRALRTILLSYNGTSKQFKSMDYPKSTEKVITFLTSLGSNVKLPRYSKPLDFEDVLD